MSFLKEINFSFQASEELEDRQSLAVMAASGQDEVTGPDGETFIEKYTRGVSAVETILTLDRFVFEHILEPVCCNKRQKKFMTSYWFGE